MAVKINYYYNNHHYLEVDLNYYCLINYCKIINCYLVDIIINCYLVDIIIN